MNRMNSPQPNGLSSNNITSTTANTTTSASNLNFKKLSLDPANLELKNSCLNPHQINSPNNYNNTNFTPLPNHEPTKCSFKKNGIVKAYAANTNQGLIRNYNEDRVSIILNIMQPASRQKEVW